MALRCAEANQPAAAFFLRQPSKPKPTRPLTKRGSAAGKGTTLAAVVTTISSIAKSSAPEVKVTEVKAGPLKVIDPSGKLNPAGIVPVADPLAPALLENDIEVVFAGSFKAIRNSYS
jgi:hypothetical protein